MSVAFLFFTHFSVKTKWTFITLKLIKIHQHNYDISSHFKDIIHSPFIHSANEIQTPTLQKALSPNDQSNKTWPLSPIIHTFAEETIVNTNTYNKRHYKYQCHMNIQTNTGAHRPSRELGRTLKMGWIPIDGDGVGGGWPTHPGSPRLHQLEHWKSHSPGELRQLVTPNGKCSLQEKGIRQSFLSRGKAAHLDERWIEAKLQMTPKSSQRRWTLSPSGNQRSGNLGIIIGQESTWQTRGEKESRWVLRKVPKGESVLGEVCSRMILRPFICKTWKIVALSYIRFHSF